MFTPNVTFVPLLILTKAKLLVAPVLPNDPETACADPVKKTALPFGLNDALFVMLPPTYKSPPLTDERVKVVPTVTFPVTTNRALVLLIFSVPDTDKFPPTVTIALIAPVVKVAPVLVVKLPAIARAVPASAFNSVNVALLLTNTLLG